MSDSWHQMSNFSAISWREQVTFWWDDNDFRFVLDQHTELDFYSATSLKQQSVYRHVTPLGHIILNPCQPFFALTPKCCLLNTEATNTNFKVFGLTWLGLEPTIYDFEVSTLSITPLMRLMGFRGEDFDVIFFS